MKNTDLLRAEILKIVRDLEEKHGVKETHLWLQHYLIFASKFLSGEK